MFKDPVTDMHKNTLEKLNNVLQQFIKPRNKYKNYIKDNIPFLYGLV